MLLEQCRKERALNASNWQDEAQVLEAAGAADKTREKAPGTAHGPPVLLKPTSGPPAPLRAPEPQRFATIAHRLTRQWLRNCFFAGAILLGKTNMHELAYGITSNNGAFGAVHNPCNPALVSGGSGSGNACCLGP